MLFGQQKDICCVLSMVPIRHLLNGRVTGPLTQMHGCCRAELSSIELHSDTEKTEHGTFGGSAVVRTCFRARQGQQVWAPSRWLSSYFDSQLGMFPSCGTTVSNVRGRGHFTLHMNLNKVSSPFLLMSLKKTQNPICEFFGHFLTPPQEAIL